MNMFYVVVLNVIGILDLLFLYMEHLYKVLFFAESRWDTEIQLTVEFYIKSFEDFFSVENIFVSALSIIILLIVLKKFVSMAKEIVTKHAFYWQIYKTYILFCILHQIGGSIVYRNQLLLVGRAVQKSFGVKN